MARPFRIEYPGAIHHVIAHSVPEQDLFRVDGDRHKFLCLLGDVHQQWGTVCHGYCLMSNHYHLSLETPDGALSEPVKWLNQRYASYLNWRLQRRGHVFDGRFKSVVVEVDTYLHELSRYIHLNPVRAGMVPWPADYHWSSFRAFIGITRQPPWLSAELVLSRFGSAERRQEAYRHFVEADIEAARDPLQDVVYGAILGSRGFADAIRASFAAAAVDPNVSYHAQIQPNAEIETIRNAVAREYGVPHETLRCKGRRDREPKDVAIYLSARRHGHKLADVGGYFGGMGPSAACEACRRVESRLDEDVRFRERVERLGSGLQSSISS